MTMVAVFGKTDEGLSYTANYGPVFDGAIQWIAHFRDHGLYRGRRSGIVRPGAMGSAQLMRSVMDMIEGTLHEQR